MSETIYHGLDIGSKNLKFITVSYDEEKNISKVVYKTSYPSQGVSYGYISNAELFDKSLREAIVKYKKEAGFSVNEVILSINTFGLKTKSLRINHHTINQQSISEVDLSEVERKIVTHGEKNISGSILSSGAVKYIINNYEYFSEVEGLDAKKFEAEYIFTYIPPNHIHSIENVFEKRDLLILNPIFSGNSASAEINSDKEDRNLGFLDVDFGAKLTTLSLWENNKMIFLDSIKYGSENLTRKIALKNKISVSEAFSLKKNYDKNKAVQKLISGELKILAKKIKRILSDLERDELLPAGVVLHGGGAKLDLVFEIFREELSMPIKKYAKNIYDAETDYYNAYGAVMSYILKNHREKTFNFSLVKKIFSKFKLG